MSVQHQPLRASDRDRDEVLVRLHTAYAEGRLSETELDERIDLTLAARTHDDLGRVSADLPGPRPAAAPGAPAGRLQVAYKDTVTRGGRWCVPDAFTSVVYKGRALLDLRTAELTAPSPPSASSRTSRRSRSSSRRASASRSPGWASPRTCTVPRRPARRSSGSRASRTRAASRRRAPPPPRRLTVGRNGAPRRPEADAEAEPA